MVTAHSGPVRCRIPRGTSSSFFGTAASSARCDSTSRTGEVLASVDGFFGSYRVVRSHPRIIASQLCLVYGLHRLLVQTARMPIIDPPDIRSRCHGFRTPFSFVDDQRCGFWFCFIFTFFVRSSTRMRSICHVYGHGVIRCSSPGSSI